MKTLQMLSVLLFSSFSFADGPSNPILTHDPSWSAPHAPYQITEHVYAVGTDGIGVYLITTPKGHILLDAATEAGAAIVEANIQSLGFKLTDIKYLIENHAHSDHVGGMAKLKADTGATLIASKGDRHALEKGKLDNETLSWDDKFPPIKVDRIITDGEKISLGGLSLQAVLTPGHTKGCTSWLLQENDKGVARKIFFAGSLTVADGRLINNKTYPDMVKDFRSTFAHLKKVQADILLTGHPSMADLEQKYQAQKNGKADAFVDANALPKLVEKSEQKFEDELKRQQTLNL